MSILPGDNVLVFDPKTEEFKKAIVLSRYGFKSEFMKKHYGEKASRYSDVIDVRFQHDGRISKKHFTEGVIKIERIGVYEVLSKFLDKNNVYRIQMECTECGAIKTIRAGNVRHFEKTKFCRSCPPEVRSKVYGETWHKKTKRKERKRLLSKKELKSREEWIQTLKMFKGSV